MVLAGFTTLAAATVAACSSSGDAPPVTASRRSTTTTTTTPPGGAGSTVPDAGESPPQPVWSFQVGGPGEDSLRALSGRGAEVVAVGATSGLPPDPATGGIPAAGGADTLSVTVASADGAPGPIRQAPGPDREVATAVTAAPTGAAVSCGEVAGTGPGTALWCATLGPDGVIGPPTVDGDGGEALLGGAAMVADGTHAFVAASTDGLFPGAQDPTGGFLGERDALVLRVDDAGIIRWARQFGSAGDDEAVGAATAPDGDALTAGSTAEAGSVPGLGGTDGWVARFDPAGNQRWLTPFGTTGTDRAVAVSVGGRAERGTELVVAAGSTDGTLPSVAPPATDGAAPRPGGAAGGTDAVAAAFDTSGAPRWAVQWGSPGEDRAVGVVVDGDTVVVAGTVGGPVVGAELVTVPGAPTAAGGGRDGFLAGLDSATGLVRWVAVFGTAADEEVTGLTRTEDGHLVVAGTTTGQMAATPPGGGVDGFLLAFPPPPSGGGAASVL